MPPGLPVKFQNVHYYRVAGHYVFAGDLFIARNNLYFFPEVDLAQEREDVSRVLPHEIALVLVMLMSLGQRVGFTPRTPTTFEKLACLTGSFKQQPRPTLKA
jgi:hypothetical protein